MASVLSTMKFCHFSLLKPALLLALKGLERQSVSARHDRATRNEGSLVRFAANYDYPSLLAIDAL